uniref:Serine carboxypeptidase n=1 Tax=Meloidogyne javanica TaxID=6303 RepID=A0A915MGQ7_MELJA
LKTPKRPWLLDGQIGGWVTDYHGDLTFLTVKGVGHMVTKWAPARADYIIKQFLMDKEI